jgi:hypothetical protein
MDHYELAPQVGKTQRVTADPQATSAITMLKRTIARVNPIIVFPLGEHKRLEKIYPPLPGRSIYPRRNEERQRNIKDS